MNSCNIGLFSDTSPCAESHLFLCCLDGNKLTTLHETPFTGLTAMTSLYLYDNQISIIENDAFSELSALKLLRLDGNSLTVDIVGTRSGGPLVPLHEAIQRAVAGNQASCAESGELAPATPQQIVDVAQWIAHRIFSDAWQVLRDREEREARGEDYREFYKSLIYAQMTFIRTLLSSPSVYDANLCDMEGVRKLVNTIVRLDRLPSSNSLEGLLLIKSAWCDYDVAMMLADWYKK